MRLIYIAHPYTGDESKNRADAEQIAASLAKKFPTVVFINPLNVFRHLKKAETSYDDTLAQCIALMEKCDGVIMTGDWKDSEGCRREYEHAKAWNMTVYESKKEFVQDAIMPNDCGGAYPCCGKCLCVRCADREECWNCNDCIRAQGKRYAIGYTKNKAECSRFREEE